MTGGKTKEHMIVSKLCLLYSYKLSVNIIGIQIV